MPRRAKELSAVEVRRLSTRSGLHAVGGVVGLYLSVSGSGAASWVLRIKVGDRRIEMGLGSFPTITLEAARQRAREAHELRAQGKHPLEEKRAANDALRASDAKRLTFDQAVERYLRHKVKEFRNPKHADQWRNTLRMYASPVIGKLQVADIELSHIVALLTRDNLWTDKTETATRLRGRIEQVLAWATVNKFRSGDNPARWRGNLDITLPRPSKIQRRNHYAAIPWQEIPEFVKALRAREGVAPRALEFVLLTAARSGEARLATWEEIDGNLWTVPADRMKAGKAHRVPLSPPAMKILRTVPKRSAYIFAAPRGGPLSDAALSAVMKRMQVAGVPHGLRSSFKDWCRSSTSYPDEVSELALAHVGTDATRAAYARDELLPQRDRLMREWAKYCESGGSKAAKVTPIRGKGRG